MPGLDYLSQELAALEASGRKRALRTVVGAPGRIVQLDGRSVVNFSSNNYLGLADHPALMQAAVDMIEKAGVGAGASRLVVGNQDVHEQLERELAEFHGKPAALLFNSGYSANLGTLEALAGEGDVIFSDALNHASIIDGCRLSRAAVVVYPHRDMDALRRLLGQQLGRRRFIVTDTVFSMDGDVAPLRELVQLCGEFDAALIVDEAHAVGVLGPLGRGGAAEAGVSVDVEVGTLGKSFGTFGAYVTGSRELIELLISRARTFMFTTALPPGCIGATRAALRWMQSPEGEARRVQLAGHIRQFRDGLSRLGVLGPGAGSTAIFPVIVGDEGPAMECTRRLLEQGIYVQGIRPPTVPRGTSRLRFALMATHTAEDLERALEGVRGLIEAGLIPQRIGGSAAS